MQAGSIFLSFTVISQNLIEGWTNGRFSINISSIIYVQCQIKMNRLMSNHLRLLFGKDCPLI